MKILGLIPLAVVAAFLIVPSIANAAEDGSSCANAITLAPGTSYTADTTVTSNFIGAFGPIPSPGPDMAFKFVANSTGVSPITIGNSTYNWGISLTSNCQANASLIQAAAGNAGDTGSLAMNPLVAGQTYYIIVTGNPGDSTGPSGTLTFATPTPLPVKLQTFSVQ